MHINNKVLIIAEAGINHNGSLTRAIKMIKVAKKIGADVIKFQTAVPELMITKNAKKANYQKTGKLDKETQVQMIKKFHLPLSAYKILKNACKKNDITFLSSPFDILSAKHLINLKINKIKIPSGEITNFPLIKFLAKQKVEVILSTGMSNIKEIKNAIRILKKFGCKNKDISILHCNSSYPTPYKDVNLNTIQTLKKKFSLKVGYSDHTNGIEVAIAAVCKGAKIIEKHFTLNKNLKGPDHKVSLDPKEFELMVKSIRNVESSFGSKNKIVTKSEKPNIQIVRKSIVAKIFIKKGTKFNEENIATKRPGNGISPMNWGKILGKKAIKDFNVDDFIIL